MSPWSSRGHRILGSLEGQNLKNSVHERLSQDNFLEKGRSIPHGGRMSPWSSRGHRILGALDGKFLKNSAHERLSQDNFLENTALKVFLFVTEHIDVELR